MRGKLFHQRMFRQQEAVVRDYGDAFLHQPSGDLRGSAVGADQHGDVAPRAAFPDLPDALQQPGVDFFVKVLVLVPVDAPEPQVAFGLAGCDLLFGAVEAFPEQPAS